MKNTVLMMVLLLASWSQATEVGFKNGNERTSISIQGDIMVTCDDPAQGTQFRRFHCERDILLPSEFAYFHGPEGVRADEVTLTATREDQSVKSKTLSYDTQEMQSSKQFNLWISSLLQRPLLKMGGNQMAYVMKYKGKVTSSGNFEAVVKDGGTRVCRNRGSYWSNVGFDCMGGGSKFCDQFFYERKYCL